jgi:hypothetical protein
VESCELRIGRSQWRKTWGQELLKKKAAPSLRHSDLVREPYFLPAPVLEGFCDSSLLMLEWSRGKKSKKLLRGDPDPSRGKMLPKEDEMHLLDRE